MEDTKTRLPNIAPWINKYNSKVISSDEAVKVIKSGDNIVVQPGCAAII